MTDFDFGKMEEEISKAEQACANAYNEINREFFLPIVDIETLEEKYKALKNAYKKRNKVRTKYSKYALRSFGCKD